MSGWSAGLACGVWVLMGREDENILMEYVV